MVLAETLRWNLVVDTLRRWLRVPPGPSSNKFYSIQRLSIGAKRLELAYELQCCSKCISLQKDILVESKGKKINDLGGGMHK